MTAETRIGKVVLLIDNACQAVSLSYHVLNAQTEFIDLPSDVISVV